MIGKRKFKDKEDYVDIVDLNLSEGEPPMIPPIDDRDGGGGGGGGQLPRHCALMDKPCLGNDCMFWTIPHRGQSPGDCAINITARSLVHIANDQRRSGGKL